MRLLTTLATSVLLFVFTNAQSTTSTAVTSAAIPPTTTTEPVTSGTAPLTPAQSSQAACLAACPATDANCRASCVPLSGPTGDYGQQNATIECVSACDHGNGTAAENLAYEDCLKGCVASATITPATTAAVQATPSGSAATHGGSGSGATAPANAQTTEATGTNAGAATGTSSASASATSKAAADTMRVGVSLAGIVGVFAVVFAL